MRGRIFRCVGRPPRHLMKKSSSSILLDGDEPPRKVRGPPPLRHRARPPAGLDVRSALTRRDGGGDGEGGMRWPPILHFICIWVSAKEEAIIPHSTAASACSPVRPAGGLAPLPQNQQTASPNKPTLPSRFPRNSRSPPWGPPFHRPPSNHHHPSRAPPDRGAEQNFRPSPASSRAIIARSRHFGAEIRRVGAAGRGVNRAPTAEQLVKFPLDPLPRPSATGTPRGRPPEPPDPGPRLNLPETPA